MLSGLRSWYQSTPNPTSTQHRDLCQLKNLLGWQSLFEGRPAKGWQDAQQHYYNTLGLSNTGRRWLLQLLLQLFNMAWDLWELRNRVLHNKETTLVHEIQIQEVKEAFELSHLQTPDDARKFFKDGLQKVLNKKPHLREAWLLRVHTALEDTTNPDPEDTEAEQSQAALCHQQYFLHRWLQDEP